MMLFIACLLIYQLDMSGWWYVAASVAYGLHELAERGRAAEISNNILRIRNEAATAAQLQQLYDRVHEDMTRIESQIERLERTAVSRTWPQ